MIEVVELASGRTRVFDPGDGVASLTPSRRAVLIVNGAGYARFDLISGERIGPVVSADPAFAEEGVFALDAPGFVVTRDALVRLADGQKTSFPGHWPWRNFMVSSGDRYFVRANAMVIEVRALGPL
ncbi:MAG: hypothetical protein IT374_13425 [Polyangiaceae bacterium]|nr:hypothetical protein [Polyangiaceae bacterium]